MLLFDELEEKTPEPKPELTPVTAYFDDRHCEMLDELLKAGGGKLNKSEVIRQCVRLGHKRMKVPA